MFTTRSELWPRLVLWRLQPHASALLVLPALQAMLPMHCVTQEKRTHQNVFTPQSSKGSVTIQISLDIASES